MTEDDKKLLNNFEGKLRHFIFLYEKQKQENLSLRTLLSKKEEIRQMENSRKELEEKYTNLKTARILSINDNELHNTKQRLAGLA